MQKWEEYVREHLALGGIETTRKERIVAELAQQLEEFYREARTRGASEPEAEAHVLKQVKDWVCFESDIRRVERRRPHSVVDRWGDRSARMDQRKGGWGMIWSDLMQDLAYGARLLRRSPGFTVVAVLTLALGIGATTTVFSVVHGVLLRPLPYPEPDRLVRVFESNANQPTFPLSPLNFQDYRAENHVFTDMAIYMRNDLELSEGERPQRLLGMQVSAGFFHLLGFQPLLGRAFLPEDELPGSPGVVVLSHRLWRDRFAGDPDIVEKQLTLSGNSFTVVGVLPPGVQHVGGSYRSLAHGDTVDIWWPFTLTSEPIFRRQHFTNGLARLKPDVSLEEAAADLNIVTARLEQQVQEFGNWRIRLMPLREEIIGNTTRLLLVFFGAVTLVLMIACANVANLLLSRAAGREREIALRQALGAGRARVGRQLLTESILLALLGGLLGLIVSMGGVRLLVSLAPGSLPRTHMIEIGIPFLGFAAGLSALTVLFFGLAPALLMPKLNLMEALKESGRRTTGAAQNRRVQNLLVTAEISLAVILLTGASLLLQSYLNLQGGGFGFEPHGVLTGSIYLPGSRYEDADGVISFFGKLREAAESLPGVSRAGLSSDLPWSGWNENSGFEIEGYTPDPDEDVSARFHFVTPGYFETIGTPLVAGRMLTPSDNVDSPPVIVINRSLAERFWPESAEGRYPLGKRLDLWGEMRTIVGIVGDVKDYPSDAIARPAFYFPYAQNPRRTMMLVLRTEGDPLQLAETVRRTVLSLDPSLPVAEVQTLDQIATESVSEPRFSSLIVGLFAATALLLASVGTYGVVSYAVGRRTHEFGVRSALGADKGSILYLVLHQGLKLALTGLLLGVAGAYVVMRFLRGMLFGVSPTDPWTFLAAALFLLGVALLASYIPAVRATRVDPMVALRYE